MHSLSMFFETAIDEKRGHFFIYIKKLNKLPPLAYFWDVIGNGVRVSHNNF
jgi:hypothetical protein